MVFIPFLVSHLSTFHTLLTIYLVAGLALAVALAVALACFWNSYEGGIQFHSFYEYGSITKVLLFDAQQSHSAILLCFPVG